MQVMKTFLFFVAFLVSGRGLAQIYVQPDRFAEQSAVGVRVGASPTLQMELTGFVPLKTFRDGNKLAAALSFRSPFFLLPQLDSFGASVGGAYQVVITNQWRVTWAASGLLGRTANVNGRFTALGTDFALLPGYHSDRFYGVLWLGWQYHARTHLRHSDYAQRHFLDRYPPGQAGISGPTDGWYAVNFSTLRLGAGTGYAFRRISLHLNGGWQTTGNDLGIVSHGDLAILPFFVNAGVTYHW